MSRLELQSAALVTGAERGIGAAYAERLARRGRDLILVAGDGAALEGMARRLRPRGIRIELVVADLARADDLAAVETQLRGDDRIAVLVNDADAGDAWPLAGLHRSGVTTATRLARAAAESFVAQRFGTILNVAVAADASALTSFIAFSRALRDELRPHGVHVKARVHRLSSPPDSSSPPRSVWA